MFAELEVKYLIFPSQKASWSPNPNSSSEVFFYRFDAVNTAILNNYKALKYYLNFFQEMRNKYWTAKLPFLVIFNISSFLSYSLKKMKSLHVKFSLKNQH